MNPKRPNISPRRPHMTPRRAEKHAQSRPRRNQDGLLHRAVRAQEAQLEPSRRVGGPPVEHTVLMFFFRTTSKKSSGRNCKSGDPPRWTIPS